MIEFKLKNLFCYRNLLTFKICLMKSNFEFIDLLNC